MEKDTLIEHLKEKHAIEVYAKQAVEDKSTLPILLEIIETDKTSLKFLGEKIMRQLSESHPEMLYPYFERMARLWESENNFIQWGFILSVPNLVRVDVENKWEKVHDAYLALLKSDALVTCGNAVAGVWKILQKYPQYEQDFLDILLKIDRQPFLHKGEVSPECVNVAKGHVLDCFARIYPASSYKDELRAFAQANLDNPRTQVRQKAQKFLMNTA